MRQSRQTSRKRRQRRRPAPARLVILGAFATALFLTGASRAIETIQADPPGAPAASAPMQSVTPVKPRPSQPTQPPESAAPAVSAPASDEPSPAVDDWRLLLVNPWTPLPGDYEVNLTQLKNGHAVDERCYPALQAMMDACRAAGLSPVICSSYRSQEKQERLFQQQVDKLIAQGYSDQDARAEAGRFVAVPGTSEHQLGLAVDIVDLSNQNLNESQEDTPVQKWLMEHSWEYGFILRYPNEKSELTGIIYEPWHYRYVGKEAAGEIYELGVCLEEYLAS